MKKLILLAVVSILLGCSSGIEPDNFKQFGSKAFDLKGWAVANELERGEMFYEFLQSNSSLIGKKRQFVVENLGENTGYYLYDHYPAYYIGPKPEGSAAKAYLVAFVIDHETDRVTDIYVHPEL